MSLLILEPLELLDDVFWPIDVLHLLAEPAALVVQFINFITLLIEVLLDLLELSLELLPCDDLSSQKLLDRDGILPIFKPSHGSSNLIDVMVKVLMHFIDLSINVIELLVKIVSHGLSDHFMFFR